LQSQKKVGNGVLGGEGVFGSCATHRKKKGGPCPTLGKRKRGTRPKTRKRKERRPGRKGEAKKPEKKKRKLLGKGIGPC